MPGRRTQSTSGARCKIRLAFMRDDPYRCEPLPPWLLAYLSAGADQLQGAYYRRSEKKKFDVPRRSAALGFQQEGRGKRRDVFLEFDRAARDRGVAMGIEARARREPNQPIEEIVAALAEAKKVSPETIWRAWEAWRPALPRRFWPARE